MDFNETLSLLAFKGELRSLSLLKTAPTPRHLRVSQLSPYNQPGAILRGENKLLKELNLSHNDRLFVEVLPKAEELEVKTTLFWLTLRSLENKEKKNRSFGPLIPIQLVKQQIQDLAALKAKVATVFDGIDFSNMTIFHYQPHLFCWKELHKSKAPVKKKEEKSVPKTERLARI